MGLEHTTSNFTMSGPVAISGMCTLSFSIKKRGNKSRERGQWAVYYISPQSYMNVFLFDGVIALGIIKEFCLVGLLS